MSLMDSFSYAHLKPGFIVPDDLSRSGSWSETIRYMHKSLQRYFPGMVDLSFSRHTSVTLKSANRLSLAVFNKRFNLAHNGAYARHAAREIEQQLKVTPIDFIIAPAASVAISRLNTNIPIVYITDTTFKLLNNYYEWFSNFWPMSVSVGNRIEKRALDRAAFIILSSEWVKKSVVNDYSINKDRIAVIPFGANIDWVPAEDIPGTRDKGETCNLLFIGREWSRKGGEVVLETCRQLNAMGIKPRLTLVGSNISLLPDDFEIEVYPHLNKKDPRDKQLFYSLFRQNHFLILPTSAECFGIVFCEASAFGLPSITYDTGGIPSAVINGRNGFRLPIASGSKEFAVTIRDIYQDFNERYRTLSFSSRGFYESTLNWDAWAGEFIRIIQPLLSEF